LVESRRDGQFVYYRARPDVIEAYMGELRRLMGVEPVPAPASSKGGRGRLAAHVRE